MRRVIQLCKKIVIRRKYKNHVVTLAGIRLRHSHNSHPVPIILDKVGKKEVTNDMISHIGDISRIHRARSSNSSIGNGSRVVM